MCINGNVYKCTNKVYIGTNKLYTVNSMTYTGTNTAYRGTNIRSYVINRMQGVRGVPQGSQARPRIFNIFLNDLFHFLEGLC